MSRPNPQPFWDHARDWLATGVPRGFHRGFDINVGHQMAMEPLWRPVWVWPTLIAYLPGFASAFIVVWGYNYTYKFMQWADGKEWRDSWQKTYKSLWHYTMPAAWKTEDDYPWVIKPKSEKKDKIIIYKRDFLQPKIEGFVKSIIQMETLLPIVATGLSIGLGLSPYKTIQEIQQQGDTQNIPFAPFFAICVNSVLAFGYGLLANNNTIIFVNGFNSCASMYYIYVYYRNTKQTDKLRALIISACVGFVVLWYHIVYQAGEAARVQLGILSNIGTVIMFASPLSSLTTVIKTKNAASIPKLLSLASLACSISWFLFGVTIWDYFVMIPNVIGVVLSSIQLSLVAIYGQRKPKELPMALV